MRTGMLITGLVLAAGCLAEDGGSLVITEIAAIDEQCELTVPTRLHVSSDYFDAAPGASYYITPVVRNDMLDEQENTLPVSKDVVVSGFRMCWFEVADVSGLAAHDIDCKDLPEDQKAFVPAAATVPAGGGEAGFWFGILDPPALQGLWSNGLPPDPNGTAIAVKLQAVAQTKSGEADIESNWFLFGIEVCNGCIVDLIDAACGGDNRSCLAGGCQPFQGNGAGFTCSTVAPCGDGT